MKRLRAWRRFAEAVEPVGPLLRRGNHRTVSYADGPQHGDGRTLFGGGGVRGAERPLPNRGADSA